MLQLQALLQLQHNMLVCPCSCRAQRGAGSSMLGAAEPSSSSSSGSAAPLSSPGARRRTSSQQLVAPLKVDLSGCKYELCEWRQQPAAYAQDKA